MEPKKYDPDDRSLLFRNVDAKTDDFQNKLEKDIEKLPDSLRFIKTYLYFEFLPKLDQNIDALEEVKTTPNFDNHLVKIIAKSTRLQQDYISCFDLLQNHNIKHPKITKLVYGTFSGKIHIYDIEKDKCLTTCQQISSQHNRVDSLCTSTIKYYDSYITRIACNCRSEVYIYILSFNHSFSLMNVEFCINTIDPSVNDPVINDKISLEYLISYMKFSKDGFYLGIADYAGGARFIKFHELPVGKNVSMNNTEENLNVMGSQSNSNEDNANSNKDNKDSKEGKEKSKKDKKGDKSDKNAGNAEDKKLEVKNDFSKFTFIKRVAVDLKENFTILPNGIGNPSDPNSGQKDNKKESKKDSKKANAKDKKDKKDKNDKGDDTEEAVKLDESVYNIKSEFVEMPYGNSNKIKCDVSLYQPNSRNHCVNIHFVQKKYIFEEKYNTGYSFSKVTIGVYVAFANSTNFKYVSLYPYLTDNMKKLFKVSKGKTGPALSAEDNLTLNSQMIMKEREFLNFVRNKLDPNNPNYIAEKTMSDQGGKGDKKDDNKKEGKKDKDKDKENKDSKKPNDKGGEVNSTSKYVPVIPMNANEVTKKEISFNTFFTISCMTGQKKLNNVNNLLAIGMVDGSVLVWDCELHTDKFLFQKSSRYEITTLSIDENYLFCGSKEGLIYIYDLLHGNEMFSCSHNPYDYFPVSLSLPFFNFCVLCIDFSNKISIYNTKESNKIANLQFLDSFNPLINFTVCYYNSYQAQYNDEYVIFLCNKKENKENVVDLCDEFSYTLIDLIHFDEKKKNYIRKKPEISETDFYNEKLLMENGLRIYEKYGYKNEMRKEKIENEKRQQTAELEVEKSGYEKTIKLNLERIKAIKEAAENENQKTVESNASKNKKSKKKKNEKSKKKDKKKVAVEDDDQNKTEENIKLEENAKLQEKIKKINEEIAEIHRDSFVPPEKIDLPEKNNYFVIFSIRDILFKCYDNLPYVYQKNNMSLKNLLKEYSSSDFRSFEYDKKCSMSPGKQQIQNEIAQKNFENIRHELMPNAKPSVSRPSVDVKESPPTMKTLNTIECVSTQQKDVIYNSFKNIKDRYSYKDKRINDVQLRNEKIVRELNPKKNLKKKK